MPEKTLDSYLVGCSYLTNEETEPIKESHRQWLTTGISGLSLLVSGVVFFPLRYVARTWVTCFATPIPSALKRCIFGVFFDKCPRFFSLVAAQRCIQRL